MQSLAPEQDSHRIDAYIARFVNGGDHRGLAVVDGVALPVSRSADGRSSAFVAEAGKPLRVLVDPDLMPDPPGTMAIEWYLTAQGHDDKTVIPVPRPIVDKRSGACLPEPVTIHVPADATGSLRLSRIVTDEEGATRSQWSSLCDVVVMPKGGAAVAVNEDGSTNVTGRVQAGEKLEVSYDLSRLRALLGSDLERAFACISFDGEPPIRLPVTLPGAREMVAPAVRVPYDADKAWVWFEGEAFGLVTRDAGAGEGFGFSVALPKDDADPSWKKLALKNKGMPKLTEDNIQGIGPSAAHYNCIAWSIGSRQEWVWPGTTLASFDALYEKHGYQRLDNLDLALSPGVEKIALYGNDATGLSPFEATHAARQLADGRYSSKLGTGVLIAHADARVVEGPSYGQLTAVYARPRQS